MCVPNWRRFCLVGFPYAMGFRSIFTVLKLGFRVAVSGLRASAAMPDVRVASWWGLKRFLLRRVPELESGEELFKGQHDFLYPGHMTLWKRFFSNWKGAEPVCVDKGPLPQSIKERLVPKWILKNSCHDLALEPREEGGEAQGQGQGQGQQAPTQERAQKTAPGAQEPQGKAGSTRPNYGQESRTTRALHGS